MPDAVLTLDHHGTNIAYVFSDNEQKEHVLQSSGQLCSI